MTKIVYERPNFYVAEAKKGFEVYRNGPTAATRVAFVGTAGTYFSALYRAMAECDRREQEARQ
jgi:hypothetical protein